MSRLPLYRREFVRLIALLVTVGAALATLYLAQPGPVTALASAVSDPYYRFGPTQPHPAVVFVAVDHAAVKAFGRWPWPRDRIAAGIDKLKSARVIALDMVFSEPTHAALDKQLGAALGRTTTVGGYFLNGARATLPDAEGMNHLANSALTEVRGIHLIESPVAEVSISPILAGQTLLASLNTLPDADERFRHYPIGFVLAGMVQPSLGVQTLQAYLNQTAQRSETQNHGALALGPHKVAIDTRGFTRLNFYPEASFTTLSFADLFAPSFDSALIRDKIVVIGVTEAGVSDIRATPLGQYPGPLMHATFLSNVLDDKTLRELSLVEMSGMIALTLAITLAALGMRNLGVRMAFYPLVGAGLWLLGLGMYRTYGLWLDSAYLLTTLGLAALMLEAALLAHSKIHTEKLRIAFSSYLPPGIVRRIVDDPEKLRLGGEKKEITVLFSDIRGFTSMSEHIPPEKLAEIMNEYFQPMTEAIFAEGGTLDKYIGDAIMALFNAPFDQPDHALAACRAAIAMQKAQIKINETLATLGVPPLRTGIGINTGPAIVGNLGSSIRFNYTAIGDVVNLASRFESATKKLGVDILIGASVYALVKDHLPCRALGGVEIPGKEQLQTVYALDW
jgi:adenylate cyclase